MRALRQPRPSQASRSRRARAPVMSPRSAVRTCALAESSHSSRTLAGIACISCLIALIASSPLKSATLLPKMAARVAFSHNLHEALSQTAVSTSPSPIGTRAATNQSSSSSSMLGRASSNWTSIEATAGSSGGGQCHAPAAALGRVGIGSAAVPNRMTGRLCSSGPRWCWQVSPLQCTSAEATPGGYGAGAGGSPPGSIVGPSLRPSARVSSTGWPHGMQ